MARRLWWGPPPAPLRGARGAVLIVVVVLLVAVPAAASERYALIVSGANGEPSYSEPYGQWRQRQVTALLEKFGFDDSRVVALFDGGDPGHVSTAINVRRSLAAIRARMRP